MSKAAIVPIHQAIGKSPCFSFSSWFCIPDQGMRDFEILCRASAFLLPVKKPQWNEHKFHVVTVGHAAAPWKFPKLYPQEWLRFVNHEHTHFTIDLRGVDGKIISQYDLYPQAYYHPKRDLCILHLDNEQKVINEIKISDFHYDLELTDDNVIDTSLQEEIHFIGYDVEDAPIKDDQRMDRARFLQTASGKPLIRTQHQIFCPTEPILTNGMCGGPVCKTRAIADDSKKIVCGLLEGIVPSDHPLQQIRSAAVFVESGEIRQFIEDVEADKIKPLVGGYARLMVGADQNPDKLDVTKLVH